MLMCLPIPMSACLPPSCGHLLCPGAVAIVLFRSLAQFSGASFTLGTLPAVALRFVALALGSLAVGCGTALACAFTLKRFWREGGEVVSF